MKAQEEISKMCVRMIWGDFVLVLITCGDHVSGIVSGADFVLVFITWGDHVWVIVSGADFVLHSCG